MAKLFPKVFEGSYLSSSNGWTSLLAPHPHQHLAFSVFKINFYWSIIASQCCVTFHCTAKWSSRVYIYTLIFGFPSHSGNHRTLSRVSVLYSIFSLIIYFVDSINSDYVLILFSCFQIFIFFYQSIGFEWYLINMKLIIYLYNYGLYSSFINGCLFLTIFSIFLLFVLAHTYTYIYIYIYTHIYIQTNTHIYRSILYI